MCHGGFNEVNETVEIKEDSLVAKAGKPSWAHHCRDIARRKLSLRACGFASPLSGCLHPSAVKLGARGVNTENNQCAGGYSRANVMPPLY